MTKRSVLISGGGPAGLAAALLFDRLGWDEIVLAERRAGPSDFEKNKSFNYLVDKRSQRLFERLGILDRLPPVGVATREFTATTITPDGKAETKGVPIIDPGRPVCYWTTRRALLTMLYEAIGDLASERVRLLYGHKAAGLSRSEAGGLSVEVEDGEGRTETFEPTLVLACDGLNSAIRAGLSAMPGTDPARFEMIATPSLSTGLRYKVLNLPSRFATKGGAEVDDPAMSYILPSRHKERTKACALFAFPVADASHPRSVNMIREADHEL
ncbi:MAG: FAD-dependent monooxygenase, partial [Erythrobacter sp.]